VQSCVRSLLARILETRERLGRTTIVAISGIDCAGKSTFAAQLAAGLRERGKDVVVIDGDDFNRPRNERLPYPAEDSDYGFAYGQLADELLVPARENIRVATRLRVKDWAADVWRQCDFVVEPSAIVLVEGVFLFTPSSPAAVRSRGLAGDPVWGRAQARVAPRCRGNGRTERRSPQVRDALLPRAATSPRARPAAGERRSLRTGTRRTG
jgi:hypothetical protein